MLWLHDLQENVDELNLLVYGSIIPGFPGPVHKIDVSRVNRTRSVIDRLPVCISGTGYVPLTSSQSIPGLDAETGDSFVASFTITLF